MASSQIRLYLQVNPIGGLADPYEAYQGIVIRLDSPATRRDPVAHLSNFGSACNCLSSTRVGYGTQCVPYGRSAPWGPASYLVSDLGKKGVPHLNLIDLFLLGQIRRFVPLANLRFAIVRNGTAIFDAKYGPCFGAGGRYRVLNKPCDLRYEPGENPSIMFAGAEPCGPVQPWEVISPKTSRYYATCERFLTSGQRLTLESTRTRGSLLTIAQRGGRIGHPKEVSMKRH